MTQPQTPSATLSKISELTAPRQALVRLCQSIDYGQICGLRVRDREPVFSPEPSVIFDVKLDAEYAPRRKAETDFLLRIEVRRLLDLVERLGTGCIQRIEVRAGIPRRILIESSLKAALL